MKNSASTLIPLEAIHVAKPCRANWEKMRGDERVRFCGTCAKNVYNLSEMSREDAENLIRAQEGELCVRFYQRADGTMLTADCPVGQRAARRPLWALVAGFAALLASGASIVAHEKTAPPTPPQPAPRFDLVKEMRDLPVLGSVVNYFKPAPMATMGEMAPIMGAIAPCPIPTPTPTAKPDDDGAEN